MTGTISVSRLNGRSLTATDNSGDVEITKASMRRVDATSGNGAVVAHNLRAQTTKLHSNAGNVTAQLTSRPRALTATAGNGDVTLDVPTGRYDIHADSDNGTVHVSGLITDTSVLPFIRAHSDAGNVRITGH